MKPDSLAAPEPDPWDLWRRLVGLTVDIHLANPHRLSHQGACGIRLFCSDEAHRTGGYRTVEQMPNGYLLAHCENRVIRPSDPEYDERRAGMVQRLEP